MTVEYNKGTACPILLSTKESAVALTMDSAKKLQADLAKVIEQAEKEPEPTEFELALRNAMSDTVALSEDREDYEVSEICDKQAKRYSADLITTAKQQLLQSGELMTQEHHEKLMETQYKETLDGVKKNWHDYFTPQAMTDIYNAGRNDVLKDLPRWRKCEKPFDSPDNCGYNGKNLIHHGYALSIDNAYTKLPKDE